MKIHYNKTTFITSAASPKQFLPEEGIEVAFIGRSNSGKSSAINVLTKQKKLARVSKDPGRTQCINFFAIDEERRLVDLPGYGYAKVSGSLRKQWRPLINTYLKKRKNLMGLVLLMDIRHPLTTLDQQMLLFAEQIELPVHVLLTKADKLSRHAALTTLHTVEKQLKHYHMPCSIQLFSALKKTGLTALEETMNAWLTDDNTEII